MKYKLMLEYGCWPVWGREEGASSVYSPLPELKISQQLLLSLESWNARFQATFDPDYPPDSGFKDPVDLEAFLSEGRLLAKQLETELGSDVTIKFFDQ